MPRKNFIFLSLLVMLISCEEKRTAVAVTLDNKKSVLDSSFQQITKRTMTQMQPVKLSGNNDRDFASLLLKHHKGAIALSEFETKQGNDVNLKKFAGKEIKILREEIERMNSFLNYEPRDKSNRAAEFKQAVFAAMRTVPDSIWVEKNIDRLYAILIREFSQNSIKISEAEISFGYHQTMKILARKIVSKQKEKVEWLNTWLMKH